MPASAVATRPDPRHARFAPLLQRASALLFGTLLILCSAFAIAQPILAERIDLIRHGESEDNPDRGQVVARLDGRLESSRGKVLSGWNSSSLTMLGVSQAVKAGEALRTQDSADASSLKEALWLYSPLLRTRQTLTGVLVGVTVLLVRFLLVATKAAQLYVAERTPAEPVAERGRRLGVGPEQCARGGGDRFARVCRDGARPDSGVSRCGGLLSAGRRS